MKAIVKQTIGRRRWTVLIALFALHCSLYVGRAAAQDVTVTVTPVQNVLPPQAMLYIANPGNYFNVSITNNTLTSQNVYLALQVEHTMPNDGLSIATPPKRMPTTPISVAPGDTRHLLASEIRTLFNHVPSNEIMASPGLFENYNNGSLGLLPEGTYQATMTAYRWDPALANPLAVSNPLTGVCNFTICYKAQAPEFLMPTVNGMGGDLSVAKLDKQNPQFTWRAPIINCNPSAVNFRYELKVVELKDRQTPDVAINTNAAVLQVKDITVPLYMVPANYFGPNRIEEGKTYVAQITAKATGFGANNLNYTSIENEGRSNLRLFELGTPVVIAQNDEGDKDKGDKDKGGDKKDDKKGSGDEDEDDSGFAEAAGAKGDKVKKDSLYVFAQPKFTYPTFDEGTARKLFLGSDMTFEWKRSRYLKGDGERQDTVKLDYEFQLFRGKPGTEKEEVLSGKPIFTQKVTGETGVEIAWDDLEKAELLINDYMVARVVPKSPNTKSLRFDESADNIIDFAMADHLSAQYFMCTGMMNLPDKTPTKKKAADFKGKTVAIGEYQLTIDEIKKVDGKDFFSGKGHVEWNPMGFKCMVCVQFDTLFINTNDIVYGGRAKTYPKPEEKGASNSEVVDKLFSDWGIDNLIGDTRIPYAKEIQDELTSQAKGLADQIDISKYYTWVTQGKAVVDQFLRGTIDNLYFPLALPKEINKTPVDIQITSMKFTPTYATMDVLGQFKLPDSHVTKNDVLLLGAPRLCISPDRVLPEAGHIALLGDMTLVEPKSQFEATFKAPQNLLEPEDGCYISWKGDELEVFGIDLDMKIPKLYKEDKQGKRTNENAIFNVKISLGKGDGADGATWDNWIASVTMDPFQVKGLDGWTFKGGSIYYDHSKNRVVGDMQDLPKNYDKELAGMSSAAANIIEWTGLYVRDMAIVMPKGLKMNSFKGDKTGMKTEDDGRLSIVCEKLLVDKTGVTANLAINNLIDVSTGKLGGWGFSMDRFYLDILMGQFQDCGFEGQIDVPLLDGNIQYLCDIKNQGVSGDGDDGDWSYTFKTQQVNDLKLDFFIGVADFYKEQTYFELSVKEDKNGNTTSRIELCAGGDISIYGSDKVDGLLAKYTSTFKKYLPFEIAMPRIHFSKLRVGNFDVAESKIIKEIKDTSSGELLNFNDLFGFKSQYEFTGTSKDENGNANKLYFGPGEWSLTMGSNQAGAHAYLPAGYGRTHDPNYLAMTDHGPTPYMDAVDAVNGDVVKGNFGPFSLSIKEYSFKQEGARMGLFVKVGLTILENLIEADAGLTIWAKVDLSSFKAEFEKPEFAEASFACDFAGCNLSGELKVDNGTNKGYSGGLHLKLPGGLIQADVTGGYYDHNENNVRTPWGWFIIKVGSSAAGLPIPPVQISSISGGFFFNCSAPITQLQSVLSGSVKPTYKKNTYGGMFGLTISTIGDENLMKAEVSLAAFVDKRNGKYVMASMLMRGEMNGLSFGGGKGLVSGTCTILYQNDPSQEDLEKKKFLELTITMDAVADATDLAKGFCESFGVPVPEVGPLQAGCQEMDDGSSPNGMKTEGKENEGDNKSSKENNEKSFSASAGVKINVQFKVTMKPDDYQGKFDTKWHLYLGNPWEQRCEVVFIDFKTHKNPKKEYFSAWAKLTASAYVCIGNELPHNGDLPPIPDRLKKFLDGPGIGDAEKGASSSAANDARKSASSSALSAGQMTVGGDKVCRGGVMFGIGSEGDFGVHAGIVYAEGYYTYGLDIALKKLGAGSTCVGGREAGYHGWYGTGQAYAMLEGEVGVHIKLFFINKTVPIVSVGVGALLQGGMPNPTWIYGKVRARCKLLGGLVSFNQAIEFKAGDVCIPNYGNPLDNIQLFASADPGAESYKEGWQGDAVSVYSEPIFTTNYRIGNNEVITLVDENEVAKEVAKGGDEAKARAKLVRKYRFQVDSVYLQKYTKTNSYSNAESAYSKSGSAVKYTTQVSATKQDFKLQGEVLQPNTYYKLILSGYAQEQRGTTWGAPYYNDEQTNWKDKQDAKRARNRKEFYFRTGALSDDIYENIAIAYPYAKKNDTDANKTVWTWDAQHPILSFKRADIPFNFDKYDYFWNVRIDNQFVQRYVANYVNEWTYTVNGKKVPCIYIWEPYNTLNNYNTGSYAGKTKEIVLTRVDKKMSAELKKRWEDAQKVSTKMIDEYRRNSNLNNKSYWNADLKKWVYNSGTSSSTAVNQQQSTSSSGKYYTYFDESGNKKTGYMSGTSEASLDLSKVMTDFITTETNERYNDVSSEREEHVIEKKSKVDDNYEKEIWVAKFKYYKDSSFKGFLANDKWYSSFWSMGFDRATQRNYHSKDDWDYHNVYTTYKYNYDPYLYISYVGRFCLIGNQNVSSNKYTPSYYSKGLTFKFYTEDRYGCNDFKKSGRYSNQFTGSYSSNKNHVASGQDNHKPWLYLDNQLDADVYSNSIISEPDTYWSGTTSTYHGENYLNIYKKLMTELLSDALTTEYLSRNLQYAFKWYNNLIYAASYDKSLDKLDKYENFFKKSFYNTYYDFKFDIKFPVTGGYWLSNPDSYYSQETTVMKKKWPYNFKFGTFEYDAMQLSLVAVLDKAYHKWVTNANWVDPYKAVPALTAKRSNWFNDTGNNGKVTNRSQENFNRFQMDCNLFKAGDWLKGIKYVTFEHWRANCYNFYKKVYSLRKWEVNNSTASSMFIRYNRIDYPFKDYIK